MAIYDRENDFLVRNGETADDRESLHAYAVKHPRARSSPYGDVANDKEIPLRIQTSVLRVSQVYIHRALVTSLANKRRRHRH